MRRNGSYWVFGSNSDNGIAFGETFRNSENVFSTFDALQLCYCRPLPSSVRNGCIVAKRCEIGLRLLLITNRKPHIGFQLTWKSSTLDDFEGQYCNRNCVGCSASSLATAGLSCLHCPVGNSPYFNISTLLEPCLWLTAGIGVRVTGHEAQWSTSWGRDVTGWPCCRRVCTTPEHAVRRVQHLPSGDWRRQRLLATTHRNQPELYQLHSRNNAFVYLVVFILSL